MQNIAGYDFEIGYSLESTSFNEVSGIYLIYTSQVWLDVGETHQLKTRMGSHERKPDWVRNAQGNAIFVAFHHENNPMVRLLKEAKLRTHLNPLCGER